VKSVPLILICSLLFSVACPAYSAEIHDAVRGGEVGVVGDLLDEEPLSVNSLDESGRSPLIIAAAAGQQDMVSLLLERGALVNATNDRGATTLHFAASRGDSQIVRVLIEHGAVVNARAIGCATPLCWASSSGREDAARVLIANGANVNAECVDLWTPLYRAASSGSLGLVALLLDHGANVDMQCVEGRSPLHNAAESGNEVIVKLLIESGAPVIVRDELGRSPLWMAVERGHTGIAGLLLENGAEIYPNQFESDQTVLHQAALCGYQDMVRLLIGWGADPAAKDADGLMAADLAVIYGHGQLARELVDQYFAGDSTTLRQGRPSLLHYSLREGEAALWYLGGHGVAVKTRSHLLVLDHSEPGALPDSPSLENGHINPAQVGGENIMAFVPGLRTGYPIRAIMELNQAIPGMRYVLGFRTDRGPEHVYVEPMTKVEVGEASVASTAPNRYARGQDFVITVDGVTIYACFSWDYWDEQSSLSYREGVEFLGERPGPCDIAIIPYAGGPQETQDMIMADLVEMSRELRPRAALCVGGAWQYARDFAGEVREQAVAETVLFGRYPGDGFIYRAGRLEKY